ncbi:ribosome maturation protein [Penicillium citrinum]|uniref:Ribosome maturation protein n=1 Tax=Penicillium citrinum TaxID=5077 RepID=A0A9W9P9H4_PENCI|nr:ribosome maturation protein [Penicillium citrinum]KAJ5240436.1 ribosome maturation protein [Penicillium citrinum]
MVGANTRQSKVFYQGQTAGFVIFVADIVTAQKWKTDHSIPLEQVMDVWKIYSSHQHGPQGMHNEASRATLEHEFGTSNDWEVIFHILEKGELQEGTASERQGVRNESQGSRGIH